MKIDYRERILVVDDEAQNQKLLKSILSIDGYIVDLASDGPAALRLVNETPPDLILLDVVMPGMDGHEVCRQLKSEMASRNIPVIFVTGQVDIEAEMRALEAGAADYLTKPLSLPIVRARVRTQLALHRQRRSLEGMFRDVIEFAPDAFVLTDNDGRIVQINARSEELFGYHRSELIGLPVETLIPDRLRGKHEGHRKTYADESRSLRMGVGLSCLRKDGTEFPGDINLSPLNTGRGRLLMAVVRDVTESLRTQQEISDSRRRLREMAMQGEAMREHERKNIAREVHDELGQVLTALRMDLTFLDLRHGSQLPALKDKLQEMRGLVDRAIQGVRNVASNLRPTALDLGLIPAIQWLCDEFSERTGVPCNFEAGRLECELPEYHSISMFRIAQESLTNITRYAQATTVLVSLSQRDGLVLLQVRDNGLGFDTNQAGRGHSFGLLGMQERAIALGGTLEVASESGRGTAVNLTVPVPPPQPRARTPMIRLLLADDHAIVRSGLKQLFSLAPDLRVVGEAMDGAGLMEALRAQMPDLVLLDINMPGVSGPDLIARIRSHWPALPLLVLSMHNEPQVAARVLKAGASGYVTKDSDMDVLLAAIRRVAGGGRFIVPELAERLVFDATLNIDQLPHSLLSERELEVFKLLVAGMGVNDIATQLCISNKTVSTHKTRLMEKMNLVSTAELVRYALHHRLVS